MQKEMSRSKGKIKKQILKFNWSRICHVVCLREWCIYPSVIIAMINTLKTRSRHHGFIDSASSFISYLLYINTKLSKTDNSITKVTAWSIRLLTFLISKYMWCMWLPEIGSTPDRGRYLFEKFECLAIPDRNIGFLH